MFVVKCIVVFFYLTKYSVNNVVMHFYVLGSLGGKLEGKVKLNHMGETTCV